MSWFSTGKPLVQATFNLRAFTILEKMRMHAIEIPKPELEKDDQVGSMLSEIHSYLESRQTTLTVEEKKKYIDQFAKALLNKDVHAFIQALQQNYIKFNLDAEASFWPACEALTEYLRIKSKLYADR